MTDLFAARAQMAIALCAPLGFAAIEAGWTVTEVGRQPWIIHGVLCTSQAVTAMPGLVYPMLGFTFLYILLGIVVAHLLHSQIIRGHRHPEWHRGYSPKSA